jgi:LacI family transcriptional regulator
MYGPVGSDTNVAFESTQEMLGRQNPPTAIICGNDEIALQVFCAVFAAKLEIPKDISVVGFDDFHTISNGLRPQLTTAALPYYFLGKHGAQLLDQVLRGETAKEAVTIAKCPLVVRASTGPLEWSP